MSLFQPVENTAEVERVAMIPVRDWTMDQANALANAYTPQLRTTGGQMLLKPIQGISLAEIATMRGFFGALPVGAGKTLIAFLAVTLLVARRPLLIVPANLLEKTMKELGILSMHWKIPRHIRIESYSKIWNVGGADLLSQYRPDLVIADEADSLRREDNAAQVRLGRYFDEENLEAMFVALTGTITRKSIKDFAHLLRWALRRFAPVPKDPGELDEWAGALDSGSTNPRAPGALMRFVTHADWAEAKGSEMVACRLGFRRRLHQTPGVICLDEQSCDQPIKIQVFSAPHDPIIEQHFEAFRDFGITPDGIELLDALSMYNHEGPLGRGLYYRWNPQPPPEWAAARKAFGRFCRWALEYHRNRLPHLDTELQVVRHYAKEHVVRRWKEIKPTFEPQSEPVWLSGSVLQWCLNWIANHPPSLIWVQEVAFGEVLSQCSGLPFYSQQGKDRHKNSIENHPANRSCILSSASNKRGRNLQRFSWNLFVGMAASATENEQKLGRTHRQGQDKPVFADILLCSDVDQRNFYAAFKEAAFVKHVQGLTQKLLIADLDTSKVDRDPLTPRWFKPSKEETL